MFNKEFKKIKLNLINRETQFFLYELEKIFDEAVNKVNERGLLSPGLGVSTVKKEVLENVKERMEKVALELANIELSQKNIHKIQKALSDKYVQLTKSILSKMSPWGRNKNEEPLNQKEFLGSRSENSLTRHFETEFNIALSKQVLVKKFNFKNTFFWLILGVLIGNIDKLLNLIIEMISLLK